MIHPLVLAAFAKKIRWQLGAIPRGRKDQMFVMEIRDFDALWKGNNAQYIPPGDPGIKGRIQRLQRYIDETSAPVPLDAPEVVWQEWIKAIGFIDGRHRVVAARDYLKADKIAVAVPPEQAAEFQRATKAKPVRGPVTI